MTTTYCEAADVAAILQLMEEDGSSRKTFDDDSKPSLTEVENWIQENEDWIDDYCLDSWRTTPQSIPDYEYKRTEPKSNVIGFGSPRSHIYYLHYAGIATPLASGSGDVFEITIDGTTWTDMLVDATEGTAYGDGDYWINPENGRLYIYGKSPKIGPGTVRIKYRYGRGAVIRPIKRACTLLTAMRFLTGDDYINLFPDNPNNIQLQAKYDAFEKEAYRIMERYRRPITV